MIIPCKNKNRCKGGEIIDNIDSDDLCVDLYTGAMCEECVYNNTHKFGKSINGTCINCESKNLLFEFVLRIFFRFIYIYV